MPEDNKKQNNSYSSSRDRIQTSSSSPDRGGISPSLDRGSGLPPQARPSAQRPTPGELRQGINSPNISPLLKRQMLAARRQGGGDGPKESKVPKNTILLMMGTAIFLDLFQWLILLVAGEYVVGEVINDLMDIPIQFGFTIWYMIRGIKISEFETFLAIAVGGVGKEVSQGLFPLWSLEVGAVIFFTRAKEKLEQAVPGGTSLAGQLTGKKEA